MKIAIVGADGRMGKMLIEAVVQHPDCQLHSAFCLPDSPQKGKDATEFLGQNSGVKVNDDLTALQGADCLIDFTRPEGTLKHVQVCRQYRVKMVIGTTGFSAEQLQAIQDAAQEIAIVLSPNMSIGVNAMYALLEQAGTIFDDNYDVEVFEAHHRNKVDAPSGTALKMAEVIAQAKGRELEAVADWARHGHTGVRKRGQIGFAVMRGGDIIGDHTVSFCGPGERIEITHKASNRSIYAQGSLKAAAFLQQQAHGFFSMRDVIAQSLS
ncbi:4-hydroxy-tetrahydrodipicolinate reductase [Brackiella oedipodis]|uniref:4-hydroxy-tetrahydrodipicolinate reductase n=1 Tax=Brackiella oedipodis TaxID=124225 RepID=UPI00048AAF63|nr:4-hydroxy-tetrahydrodipicolinate reductase [Brackiella oedipodis]